MRGWLGLLLVLVAAALVWGQAPTNVRINAPDLVSTAWELSYTPYTNPHPLQSAWVSACEDTIPASSNSRADVASAVATADDDDCVTIPAGGGSVTWTSSVGWTNKRIQIIGPGYANLTVTCSGACFGYTANTSPAKPIRISGLWMVKASASGHLIDLDSTNVRDFIRDWRIDNNKFTRNQNDSNWYIQINGISAGLVDNNIIGDSTKYEWFINVSGYTQFDGTTAGLCGSPVSSGGHCNGYDSWKAKGVSYGDRDAVYVEYNTMLGQNNTASNSWINDMEYGARFVVRFNTLNGGIFQSHSARSDDRGGNIYAEVYRNTWNGNGSFRWAGILRGGTAMVFDNTVSGFQLNRFDVDGQRENTSCLSSVGILQSCNGANGVDGNIDASGWPCLDQVGRGGVTGQETDALEQINMPMRAWMNGSSASCAAGTSGCTHSIGISINGACSVPLNYWRPHSNPHANGQWDYMNYGDGVYVVDNIGDLPASCTTGEWAWVRNAGSWNTLGQDGLGYICT